MIAKPHAPGEAVCLPPLPEDLDRFLAASEARIAGIRHQTEKKIVWRSSPGLKTDFAVVYLHGFSASRMELHPLCDLLARKIDANLFYTRLNGHGQDGHALAAAKVEDWLQDGLEALAVGNRLGRRIILIGTSTGAALATWLAAHAPQLSAIHALILISPNYSPKNLFTFLTRWRLGRRLIEIFMGNWRQFTPAGPAQERFWTVRYPMKALYTMLELVRIANATDLRRLLLPVLMLYNEKDRVISVPKLKKKFGAMASARKRLVAFNGNRDPGRHVLAGDALSPETTSQVIAIIDAFLAETAAVGRQPPPAG
jgi:pimeloyl-ACP methyl ester carboxylesterase